MKFPGEISYLRTEFGESAAFPDEFSCGIEQELKAACYRNFISSKFFVCLIGFGLRIVGRNIF